MNTCIKSLADWPKNKNKSPIFLNTAEALLYAQLVYEKPDELIMLNTYMNGCHLMLMDYRANKKPSLDYLLHLSIRARFFRECLEECERIKTETQHTTL